MAQKIGIGTILIKGDAPLPKDLRFESESYLPGWTLVKDLDGYGLDRAIQKTGWTFFYLAGEIRATVFGVDEQSMIRRAVGQILENPKLGTLNSLEITRVASAGSMRFTGIWCVTVSAHPRHLHESLFIGGKDFPRPVVANDEVLIQIGAPGGGKTAWTRQAAKQLEVSTEREPAMTRRVQ